jgi:hypothetical protein
MNNTTNLDRRIEEILGPEAAVREQVQERFDKFIVEAYEEIGECNTAFNKILGSGPFSMSPPDALPRAFAPSQDLLIAVATLAKIYAFKNGDRNARRSGWDGLNMDAKGFCRNLLICLPPANADLDELEDFIRAKTIVGLMAEDGIPSSARSITISGDKLTMLTEDKDGIDS